MKVKTTSIVVCLLIIGTLLPSLNVSGDTTEYTFTSEDVISGNSTNSVNRDIADGSYQTLQESDFADTNFSASLENVTIGTAGGGNFSSSLDSDDNTKRSYTEATIGAFSSYYKYLMPTSDYSITWDSVYPTSPSTHYDKIDELTGPYLNSDDLGSYVYTATANEKDIFNMNNMSAPPGESTITLQIFACAKKGNTFVDSFIAGLYISGNYYAGISTNLATSIQNYTYIWNTNPYTTKSWTYSEINNLMIYITSTDANPVPWVSKVGIRPYVVYQNNYKLDSNITIQNISSESYTDHYELVVQGNRSGTENFGMYAYNWTNASWGLKDVIDQGTDTNFTVPLTSYERNATSEEVKIRFRGMNETSDTTQNTLYLDVLKVQRIDTYTAEVKMETDAEVLSTGVLSLSIKSYTDDGEQWTCQIWNATSDTWNTALTITDLSNTWHNYTINNTNHIESQIVMIRFINQDSPDNTSSSIYLDVVLIIGAIANNAPEITTSPITLTHNGVAYSYDANCTDPDPPDTSFWWTLETNATFLSIHPILGYVNGTPDTTGTFWVNIIVADTNITGGNLTDSQNFTLLVIDYPVITSGPGTDAYENNLYSYTPAVNVGVDSWNYSSNASWLTHQNETTGEVYGTPDYTDVLDSYWVNITLITPYNDTTYQNYTLYVYNIMPEFISYPDTSVILSHIYKYESQTDEEGVGTSYYSINTNYDEPYNFYTLNGTLLFNATIEGIFWFNITFDDNTSTSNSTVYQNFSVEITTSVDPQFTSSVPSTDGVINTLYEYDAISSAADFGIIVWIFSTNSTWIERQISNPNGTQYCNISGTPTDAGSWWVNLTVEDGDSFDYINWTITVLTTAPLFVINNPSTTGDISTLYEWNASATEASLGTNIWVILSNATWIDISWSDETHCLVSGIPTEAGVWWVNLTIEDDDSSDYVNWTITVYPPATVPPVITSSAITTAVEDTLYSYDAEADSIVIWTMDTNATWLSIDDGIVSGTPNNTVSEQSFYINITAENDGGSDWQNYSLHVYNNPPEFTTTPDTNVWIFYIFIYEASTTDEGFGGDYSIAMNYTGSYTLYSSNGTLMFNASIEGTFWFNLTFDDNTGVTNSTIYQNFSVEITWNSPIFTSAQITVSIEDVLYYYQPICNQTVTIWNFETNATWLSQNLTTGSIQGTPDNFNSEQSFYAHVSAYNWRGTTWQNFTISVINKQPLFTTTPSTSVWYLYIYTFDSAFDDNTSGGVFVSISTDYTGAYSWNDTTGLLQFNATVIGSFWFEITVDDNTGASNATNVQNWTVEISYNTATFTSTTPTGTLECVYFAYTASLNQTISSWNLTTDAPWLAQDALTGEIYGTPSYDVSNDDFSVSIEASNWRMTTYQNWTLHVINKAPVFNSTANTTVLVNVLYLYNAQSDAEYQMGWYSIWTSYTLSYDFNTTTGLLNLTTPYAGVFTFSITINDGSGASNASTIQTWTLTISTSYTPGGGGGGAILLTASFTFTVDVNGYIVSFTDTSFGGNIISWTWNFGDNTESQTQNPIHSFKLSGTYQVKLTVEDSTGKVSSITKTVTTTVDSNLPIIPFNLAYIPILIGIILGMLLAILSDTKYMRVCGVILILASVTIFFGMVI